MNRAWELLLLLTLRDLKLRYQGTILGILWSLIKPLMMGVALYFVFQHLIRIGTGDDPYILVVLSGLFAWSWFSSSVMMSSPSFAQNGALLKKIYFPRFVLPLSVVANNGIHFLLSMPIILVVVLAVGRQPSWTWLVGIPLLTLIQLAMLMGVVLLVASLDVFFRDLEHLVEVFLSNLWFYLTPIIWPLSLVGHWRPLMLVNPLAGLIEGWRQLFLNNRLPGVEILWPLAFSAIILAIGWLAFKRLEGHFVDAI